MSRPMKTPMLSWSLGEWRVCQECQSCVGEHLVTTIGPVSRCPPDEEPRSCVASVAWWYQGPGWQVSLELTVQKRLGVLPTIVLRTWVDAVLVAMCLRSGVPLPKLFSTFSSLSWCVGCQSNQLQILPSPKCALLPQLVAGMFGQNLMTTMGSIAATSHHVSCDIIVINLRLVPWKCQSFTDSAHHWSKGLGKFLILYI